MKSYLFCLSIIMGSLPGLMAQEKISKLDVRGYISGMPSLAWNKDSSQWQTILHNRINVDWYVNDKITSSVQFRNQIIGGDVMEYMDIENGFTKEKYALPLTFYQNLGDNYILSLSIDRAWMQYTHNKLEVKLGRQRINWGQTFVWNPNDIFNTYNYFEFDYPERPGADAIRIVYYPNYSSSIDLAAKIDSSGNITGGGLYRFTSWNTEFQLLGAYFSQKNKLQGIYLQEWEDKDLVGGLGFSGSIQSVSIRGEMSYMHSLKENSDSTNVFLASMTVDYTLANELGLMFEFLYASKVNLSVVSLLGSSGGTQHVKSLAFTKYNIFGQVSYPIMPILNGTLAGMCFFDQDLFGYFAGPSLDLSMGDNLTLGAIFQLFAFRYENPYSQKDEWANVNYAYLRLKWNF